MICFGNKWEKLENFTINWYECNG